MPNPAQVKDLREGYTQKYGFSMPDHSVSKTRRGLGEDVVTEISKTKNEPQWMLDYRLRALRIFLQKPMPTWGANLSEINFDDITYYHKPSDEEKRSWDDVPADIKKTFERLGIPQAEREYLSGVKAQYDSEVAYSSLLSELEEQGVIFLSTDEALKKHPHFFEEYFGKVIPAADNKFSALNSATWSGGSFVYIPKGVHVKRPLQAYFRINAEKMGQFERTLIIADEGSFAHYVEGCFTKGHKITTVSGFKNIEDVKVGDFVLTHNGDFKKVYHTQVRPYSGDLYRIDFDNNSLEVTEEHPILILNQDSNIPEWKAVKELKVADIAISFEVQTQSQIIIKKISKKVVSDLDVYNFSVEKEESYVCNSIAVHNCTAPVYSKDSLHSAVVEVIVKKGARFRYTTIQNWSNDVYNLVTKRARVEEDGIMEWIDGNLGSRLTMKYPSCFLVGNRAHGEVLSIAYGGRGMHQDAGAKMIHLAPNTTSTIISKSISAYGGRTSYRGLVHITPTATNAVSHVECDALILDSDSASDTFPTMRIEEDTARVEHEATVSKIGEEKLFYLTSRGLTEAEAMSLIVSGFIEPIVKELPMEYSLELNRLIELEMEGSVG